MKHQNRFSIVSNHDLYTNEAQEFDRVYVLLHGYMLDGHFMFEKLKNFLPENSLIISPNGPFLVPQKKQDKFLAKFSWYFFDPAKKTFYINYEPAAQYVKDIISKYNPDKKPVTLIGYSQGGYLSVKIAELVQEVDCVIGMACVYRNAKFEFHESKVFHQIHGDNDLIVQIDGALEEWATLKKRGNTGKFIELCDTGHKLGNEFTGALKDLIDD